MSRFPRGRGVPMADTNEEATATVPSHDALPIPDYDHLPAGSLEHRIRSLDLASLDQLIAYEEAQGARLPVLTPMRARREQLASGAEPSGGDPTAPAPEAPPAPSGQSP